MIQRASQDLRLPVYGDGQNIRDWLHVSDHCRAVLAVLEQGRPGQVYNIGGDNEVANIEIVRLILRGLGKGEGLIEFVADRPGHDRRYAMDASRIQAELGWAPRIGFAAGIAETIAWYEANREWWQRIVSGDYRAYYERLYGGR
jgi:dTDP-glucose 4,6-dehydratase